MSDLTHLDENGAARMVDVGGKAVTRREATATGRIEMSAEAASAIRSGAVAKGDVLAVARVAGIMAAKKTSDLIPLCHPLPLSRVAIDLAPDETGVTVTATAATEGQTGVEMEALTAATVALLTIYDMAKAVDKAMVIGAVRLLAKTGGKSGDWRAPEAPARRIRIMVDGTPRPTLFAHPFSSYCQKVLIALYENGIAFDYRVLGPDDPDAGAELARRWPIGKFPMLIDEDRTIVEASTIIEHLQLRHGGTLIPADPSTALEVRILDRIFDNYVMTPMQKIVADALRPSDARDPYGVTEARQMLDRVYAWLDARLGSGSWAIGQDFTLADCAAAPSLFYADWAHSIPDDLQSLASYRARLLQRPSFARAVDEARPFRAFFPLGPPQRD